MLHKNKLSVYKTEHCYNYNSTIIPYACWHTTHNEPITTIIFLGTVQIGNLSKWVAQSCPPGSVIVQGAPHWFAKSDGSDIPEYMFGFTQCAFDNLLDSFPIKSVHVIAESQAVPGVLELFAQSNYSSYVNKLSLLQPLGLNSHAYHGTDNERISIFKQRIVANALHQIIALVIDKRLRYNHRVIGKAVDLRSAKTRAQYNSGLMCDATHNLRRINKTIKNVIIICGAKDKLFPPSEIAHVLTKNRIPIRIHTIRGVPHSPLATIDGQKLLAYALAPASTGLTESRTV